MTERIDPVDYYDNQASSFATQASNEQANWFEYQENMPSLLRMAKPITGNTLDFGCGAGNFTALLQADNRTVEGCDTSSNLLKIARENYPDINFVTSDRDGNIETDALYDLVVAKLVFHYITNLETVLGNISKRLNPNGHLLFSVPHPDKTSAHFSNPTDEGVYSDEVGNFGLTLPMIHRTLGRLSTILANKSFDIIDTDTVYDGEKAKRLNVLAIKRR